jgi:hypothetical protein
MDATRELYTCHEIADGLGVNPVTVYGWRKSLVDAGKLPLKVRYTYKEVLWFLREQRSKKFTGRVPTPKKGELLKRQLQTDGYIR